jgi:HEAT repeat protein
MKNWFRYTLAIVIIFMVAVIAWLALSKPAEPVYQGKPLSVWLEVYTTATDGGARSVQLGRETDEAVRHIGTNAIPFLLNMLQARDSALSLKIFEWAKKLPRVKIHHLSATDRIREARMAFTALGASASNAVPQLMKMYNGNDFDYSQRMILGSLGATGPAASNAVPLLLRIAAETNNPALLISIFALGSIHSEPEKVVPVLSKRLRDPNLNVVCFFAAKSLGNFGTEARPATSDLLERLQDQDFQVRVNALEALARIYAKPEWNPPEPDWSFPPYKPSTLVNVINGLGAMGTNAAPAVPALVKFLTDPDAYLRACATNALKAIDPEAAAKAGVK